MRIEINITEQEIKDMILIRNYFGEHDKSCHEHFLFSVADNIINKFPTHIIKNHIPDIKKKVKQ